MFINKKAIATSKTIKELNPLILIENIRQSMKKVMVGQERAIDLIISAFLANGHVLLEGEPGLGKTTIARTFAKVIGGTYKRISFTPDIMPADILGCMILDPVSRKFEPRKGPIFANVLLCDEINRGQPKAQSALLEAMEERKVTIDGTTYDLPNPFFVLATQNPYDHDGTNVLPQTLIDRFMLRIDLKRLPREEELALLHMKKQDRINDISLNSKIDGLKPVAKMADLLSQKKLINSAAASLKLSEELYRYILDIEDYLDKDEDLECEGFSRAVQVLSDLAGLEALKNKHEQVLAKDIQDVLPEVLRHRIVPGFQNTTDLDTFTDEKIKEILEKVLPPT